MNALINDLTKVLDKIKKNNRFQDLIWVMESLLGRDGSEVLRRFGLMFHSVCVAVEKSPIYVFYLVV